MNIEKLNKEMKSEGLQELTTELGKIYNNIVEKKIPVKQGVAEIVAIKHIIQTVALDWEYGRKKTN